MKIGKFYEDANTHEIFLLDNFTRCDCMWVNVKGERIIETKETTYSHMNTDCIKDKKRIQEFLDNHNYQVFNICKKCEKLFWSRYKKHVDEIHIGDEYCQKCSSV